MKNTFLISFRIIAATFVAWLFIAWLIGYLSGKTTYYPGFWLWLAAIFPLIAERATLYTYRDSIESSLNMKQVIINFLVAVIILAALSAFTETFIVYKLLSKVKSLDFMGMLFSPPGERPYISVFWDMSFFTSSMLVVVLVFLVELPARTARYARENARNAAAETA